MLNLKGHCVRERNLTLNFFHEHNVRLSLMLIIIIHYFLCESEALPPVSRNGGEYWKWEEIFKFSPIMQAHFRPVFCKNRISPIKKPPSGLGHYRNYPNWEQKYTDPNSLNHGKNIEKKIRELIRKFPRIKEKKTSKFSSFYKHKHKIS